MPSATYAGSNAVSICCGCSVQVSCPSSTPTGQRDRLRVRPTRGQVVHLRGRVAADAVGQVVARRGRPQPELLGRRLRVADVVGDQPPVLVHGVQAVAAARHRRSMSSSTAYVRSSGTSGNLVSVLGAYLKHQRNVCECSLVLARVRIPVRHAPRERHERLPRLATHHVRRDELQAGVERQVLVTHRRPRAVRRPPPGPSGPSRTAYSRRAGVGPRSSWFIGSGPPGRRRHGPVEQTEERAVEQRGVGRADRVVAEQQRLAVQRLRRPAVPARIGQRRDPPYQRVAVVEHQLRPAVVVGVERGEHLGPQRVGPLLGGSAAQLANAAARSTR